MYSVDAIVQYLVCGIAAWVCVTAVFWSWPANRLRARLGRRIHIDAAIRERWLFELKHGARFHPEIARGREPTAQERLTDAEIAERQKLLAEMRTPLWLELAMYGLRCTFCQSFWCALLAVGLLYAPTGWRDFVCAWCAAAFVAYVLASWFAPVPEARTASKPSPCRSCGQEHTR